METTFELLEKLTSKAKEGKPSFMELKRLYSEEAYFPEKIIRYLSS